MTPRRVDCNPHGACSQPRFSDAQVFQYSVPLRRGRRHKAEMWTITGIVTVNEHAPTEVVADNNG
jgi:hypothetical protein